MTAPKKTPAGRKPARAAKTYAEAGVDIDEGDSLVDHLKTVNPAIGGFGGLAALPKGMKNPRLVLATDGVGTKLLVAQLAGRHDTIGIDLVAMVVNDLIVCGARPLHFLDYFATGALDGGTAREVLGGIVAGCREAGCELVGGETAEMPGMYAPGHYDLAGFGVGAVEAGAVVDGRRTRPGDVVIGLASAGLHSNGYSLARAALLPKSPAAAKKALARPFGSEGGTLGDELLRPTRIYVRPALDLLAKFRVRAMAHITGGGLAGNLVRSLPKGAVARIRTDAWTPPAIFDEIARRGPVERAEMFRVFNMGIGYAIVVAPEDARPAIARLRRTGFEATTIGAIEAGRPGAEARVVVEDSAGA